MKTMINKLPFATASAALLAISSHIVNAQTIPVDEDNVRATIDKEPSYSPQAGRTGQETQVEGILVHEPCVMLLRPGGSCPETILLIGDGKYGAPANELVPVRQRADHRDR